MQGTKYVATVVYTYVPWANNTGQAMSRGLWKTLKGFRRFRELQWPGQVGSMEYAKKNYIKITKDKGSVNVGGKT